MSNRMLPPLTIAALALIMWVVPSIGSQGLGTIGESYGHVDRTLVEAGAVPGVVRTALRDADRRVEAVLTR